MMQFIPSDLDLSINSEEQGGTSFSSLFAAVMLRGEFNRLKSHGVDGEAEKAQSWGQSFLRSDAGCKSDTVSVFFESFSLQRRD